MKLPFFLVDVFTRDRLTGNPVAVVLKADGLSPTRMQAIASEFVLPRTVFVSAPSSERHTAALRFFTPEMELPFAGHATIGASVLLGLTNRLSAVRVELGMGHVTAIMEKIDRRTGEARFTLPFLPQRGGDTPANDAIASALGIAAEDIGAGALQPAQFSAGMPVYLVPVRDSDVLGSISLERRGWTNAFPTPRHAVYAFAPTTHERLTDYNARMFVLGNNSGESPASGTAAGALIGLLAEQADLSDGSHTLRVRQGREMGRPGLIELQINKVDGVLKHGGIGGSAVLLAEGTIDLGE